MHTNKILIIGSVILGLCFLGLAFLYWTTPAHALPAYVPGFDTSTKIHFKHGLGSLILGLGLFVLAWFQSGPKTSTTIEQ